MKSKAEPGTAKPARPKLTSLPLAHTDNSSSGNYGSFFSDRRTATATESHRNEESLAVERLPFARFKVIEPPRNKKTSDKLIGGLGF